MLAGRKLLLADDSITIQKIVALTFADEGIEVIAVNNGAEAIEKLEENSPDIVLADIFMPFINGYQVCEYIKQSKQLKHIPVMLLVGSFEPFDEAEARRVGADDTLTKPFQSIRTLVDKVGAMMGRQPAGSPVVEVSVRSPEPERAEKPSGAAVAESEATVLSTGKLEAETQELPPPELVRPPEEPMTPAELEVVTADTQPLSEEVRQHVEKSHEYEDRRAEKERGPETMTTSFNTELNTEATEGFGEALLDLSHVEPPGFFSDDESILEIDFDDASPAVVHAQTLSAKTPVSMESDVLSMESGSFVPAVPNTFAAEAHSLAPIDEGTREQFYREEGFASTSYAHQETIPETEKSEVESSWMVDDKPAIEDSDHVARIIHPEVIAAPSQSKETFSGAHVSAPGASITLDQLSPEVVDAIARRAVEQLSERVIQEIAWDVVPQLAELMIKRMLEEREAQNR